MTRTRIQVKYCYSESDLNQFLSTLSVETGYPRLHNIQYLMNVNATQGSESLSFEGSIIAMVQYFTKGEKEDE